MEEISYSGSKDPVKRKLSKRLVVFGGLFLVVLLLLGSAGYFITRSNSEESSETSSVTLPDSPSEEITETPIPTEEPSITPEKSVTPTRTPSKAPTGSQTNKSDLNISVLNGSGVTGAAKAAADVLTAAGFSVASTGNADNTDYTDVTIQIKNSQKAQLSAIEDALSNDYTVGDTSADLPETTSYDVLIIIGS